MNLEQRVASLESLTAQLADQAGAARTSARRWRAAALATGLALVGGIGVAASSSRQVQDEITAESIQIVNGDEEVVMELSSDNTGGMLRLMNNDGDVVGQFEVYEEGGYLSVRNNDESELAVLHVDQMGGIVRVSSIEDESAVGILDIFEESGRVFVRNADGDTDEFKP